MKLPERFGMVDCKSVLTPMELNFKKLSGSAARPVLSNPTEYRQLVGALMFLVNTRPDVCFAVNTLIQHMVDHNIEWVGAKKLLRYLCGMIDHGLSYSVGSMTLLDIPMSIGLAVWWIVRAHRDAASILVLLRYHG